MTSPGPSSSDTGTFSAIPGHAKDALDAGGLVGVREHFSLQESLRVLSHYDIGVIERAREFRRGSRRAPKMRISTRRGDYLLKRRAPARAVESRVRLAHDVQRRLGAAGFPLARLVPTRDGEDGVWIEGRSYELFEFVEGDGFSKSAAASESGGRTLAQLHALIAEMEAIDVPTGSFHAAASVEPAFRQVPSSVSAVEPEIEPEVLKRSAKLLSRGYLEAARRAELAGFSGFPAQIVHGDWHPGNLIYSGDAVIAVVDFDSVRREPRISDVANGLLQFTMLHGEPDDPTAWPDGLDPRRVESFLRGYDSTSVDRGRQPLDDAEMAALPWLMIESLIFESVVPIAATGSFASIRGSAFLQMVERKVDWIWRRSSKLRRLLD